MKIARKLISLLLVFSFLIGSVPALAAEAAKMDSALQNQLAKAADDDRIVVYIIRKSNDLGISNQDFLDIIAPDLPAECIYYDGRSGTLIVGLTKSELMAAEAMDTVSSIRAYFKGVKDDPATAELDPAYVAQLKADYLERILAYPNTRMPYTTEQVFIQQYYGSFRGNVIVQMWVEDWMGTADLKRITVGGYTFNFSSGSYAREFYVYCAGEFIPVEEAYRDGILTQEDIQNMFFHEDTTSSEDMENEWENLFTDVSEAKWFYDAVRYVNQNNLMLGTSETEFSPNTTMSRAMLVTVLWRMKGAPKGFANPFRDVPAGKWYTEAIAWAAEMNIVNGVGDECFDPEASVTREQLATILYRLSDDSDDLPDALLYSYADHSDISGWAKSAMCWAVAKGVIQGRLVRNDPSRNANAYCLDPANCATRAEAATMLMRYVR